MIVATVGPGELGLVIALVLWPALSWWALRDIAEHRPQLRSAGHIPLLWSIVVVFPLVGPYLYLRAARRAITVGS